MKNEFEEIAHSGGHVEFRRQPDGSVSTTISNSLPGRSPAWFLVCVSLDGVLLDVVPVRGIGEFDPYPQPSLLACVFSDAEGMFGRSCPECSGYFRCTGASPQTACPYCGCRRRAVEFTTKNQMQFIEAFLRAGQSAARGGEQLVSINLDSLIDGLTGNAGGWVYSEERQQTQVECARCKCRFDILGEYGSCPSCESTNARRVMKNKLTELARDVGERESAAPGAPIPDELLGRCFSIFEATAQHVRQHLVRLPMTASRREEIQRLSFQRLAEASASLTAWFGIDILTGVKEADRRFLLTMLARRHLFTHNGGRVDEKYIEVTGDSTVRLHQLVRLVPAEVQRTISLVRDVSERLIDGFESITP